ncbi:hypothetical protein BGX27_003513, partial [Mortierella sp. AM989]
MSDQDKSQSTNSNTALSVFTTVAASISDGATKMVTKYWGGKDAADNCGEKNAANNWDFEIIFKGATNVPIGGIYSSDPFLEVYLGSFDDMKDTELLSDDAVDSNTLSKEIANMKPLTSSIVDPYHESFQENTLSF